MNAVSGVDPNYSFPIAVLPVLIGYGLLNIPFWSLFVYTQLVA